ncbi:hypothetical protein P280DRAFT_398928 [Massarina eburnea CBS 473.64]|uniref:Uncharacterized protein n=1 Tax=Massarina eburnea CBS 473.64 TaxID=1395130 RepID=A0A6A6S5Y6_9PLEO|nr:hypothetical protein P280DRAFT_398928 [Massarina eburnea CBS 473.64]
MTNSTTYADICVARAMLKTLGLPTEIVLEILDYAEYVPVLKFTDAGMRRCVARMGDGMVAQLCLDADVLTQSTIRTLKASKVKTKVQGLCFDFTSCDQGWTSEGTQGSFNTSSWLEVSILRPEDPAKDLAVSKQFLSEGKGTAEDLQRAMEGTGAMFVKRAVGLEKGPQVGEAPIAWYLQGNCVSSDVRHYRVAWERFGELGNERSENEESGSGPGTGLVATLREGDKVLVWARAKYPGWKCTVVNIEMTVRYRFEEG